MRKSSQAAPRDTEAAQQSRPAPSPEFIEEEIRRRAFAIYQSRAGADGDPTDDWLRAEAIVRRELGADLKAPPPR